MPFAVGRVIHTCIACYTTKSIYQPRADTAEPIYQPRASSDERACSGVTHVRVGAGDRSIYYLYRQRLCIDSCGHGMTGSNNSVGLAEKDQCEAFCGQRDVYAMAGSLYHTAIAGLYCKDDADISAYLFLAEGGWNRTQMYSKLCE